MKESVTSESHSTSKPPVSERKAAANRANAQRSTGPRTAEGKARSSLNALRHGILAKAAFNVVIEGEERRAEFEAIVAGLAQEYQPRTITEYMMVQQLAGCYWKLAKVWTFETESAWRSNFVNNLGIAEFAQLEKAGLARVVDQVMEDQDALFPEAGLGNPTIPAGPSASTMLRYQGAINSMLFRCLNFLERRRKERSASKEEAFEELDYINEPTTSASSDDESDDEQPAPTEKHKRTQNDASDAPVSSDQHQENAHGTAETAPPSAKNREETA
jgi:hypothetical protein